MNIYFKNFYNEKKNIFERFYQVDKSRGAGLGGYGLGLAIVKKILDKHKASILVEGDEVYTSFVLEIERAN